MAGAPWQKILGKIGNRAGAATGIGMGLQQIVQGRQAKKRAMESTPEEIDPNQAAYLAELNQKRAALNTGAEYTSSLDAIGDRMSQTQDIISSNSGGDAGGTIAAMLKAQQVANQGEGQVLAQGQQQEGLYNGMYGDLLNKITQRKLELGLLDRAQNMAEATQKSQNGMANLTAGAQSFMDFNGGDKKPANPALTGTQAGGMGMSTDKPGGSSGMLGKIMGGGQKPGGTGANSEGVGMNGLGGVLSKFGGGNSAGGSTGGFDFSKVFGMFGK